MNLTQHFLPHNWGSNNAVLTSLPLSVVSLAASSAESISANVLLSDGVGLPNPGSLFTLILLVVFFVANPQSASQKINRSWNQMKEKTRSWIFPESQKIPKLGMRANFECNRVQFWIATLNTIWTCFFCGAISKSPCRAQNKSPRAAHPRVWIFTWRSAVLPCSLWFHETIDTVGIGSFLFAHPRNFLHVGKRIQRAPERRFPRLGVLHASVVAQPELAGVFSPHPEQDGVLTLLPALPWSVLPWYPEVQFFLVHPKHSCNKKQHFFFVCLFFLSFLFVLFCLLRDPQSDGLQSRFPFCSLCETFLIFRDCGFAAVSIPGTSRFSRRSHNHGLMSCLSCGLRMWNPVGDMGSVLIVVPSLQSSSPSSVFTSHIILLGGATGACDDLQEEEASLSAQVPFQLLFSENRKYFAQIPPEFTIGSRKDQHCPRYWSTAEVVAGTFWMGKNLKFSLVVRQSIWSRTAFPAQRLNASPSVFFGQEAQKLKSGVCLRGLKLNSLQIHLWSLWSNDFEKHNILGMEKGHTQVPSSESPVRYSQYWMTSLSSTVPNSPLICFCIWMGGRVEVLLSKGCSEDCLWSAFEWKFCTPVRDQTESGRGEAWIGGGSGVAFSVLGNCSLRVPTLQANFHRFQNTFARLFAS